MLLFIDPQITIVQNFNIEVFKPDFTVLLGDYYARSRSWWASDTNTPEGMQLDALTS